MKRTIIYVFGPKRLSTQYFSNAELNQQDGGWLKIGQTSVEDDNIDKWDSAMGRIHGETRTGIPEVCQLFDVFEYPEQKGNTDDKIRSLLTDDIYNLECSRSHNQDIVEKYEIKAGREFVYGVTRSQVLNAIAKFERNLILDNYGKEGFDNLMKMIKDNNSGISPLELNQDDDSSDVASTDKKSEWCDNLWNSVIAKISSTISSNISNPKGRPYINFISPSCKDFFYDCGYSVRYGIATVSISTLNGEKAKEEMETFINTSDVLNLLPDLKLKQGAKNENKWTWFVSCSLDGKSDEELASWFADTILKFYRVFEK